MKVKRSSSSASVSTSRNSTGGKKHSGVGFAKSLKETGSTVSTATATSSSTSSSSPILSINSILATQMVGTSTDGNSKDSKKKQQLVSYANDILDDLEEIHKGIILGLIPKDKLLEITRRLENRKTSVTDVNLMNLIEEVELRANVELAKYSKQ